MDGEVVCEESIEDAIDDKYEPLLISSYDDMINAINDTAVYLVDNCWNIDMAMQGADGSSEEDSGDELDEDVEEDEE